MITKELVDRINYLARKSRYEGLSDEEKAEQHQVRQQYLGEIRSQVRDALESMNIKKKNDYPSNTNACSCAPMDGCGHKH